MLAMTFSEPMGWSQPLMQNSVKEQFAQNLFNIARQIKMGNPMDVALTRKALVQQARERMQAFLRNRISVTEAVSELSVAERQMVAFARAMTEPGIRLVILEEPTSALSAEEADHLADLVNPPDSRRGGDQRHLTALCLIKLR